MKTEKDLQKYLKKQCKKNGVFFAKLESRSGRGFPDCILVFDTRVVFIELKSPAGTGRLSELQRRCHSSMSSAGADVRVMDSVARVDGIIDELVRWS